MIMIHYCSQIPIRLQCCVNNNYNDTLLLYDFGIRAYKILYTPPLDKILDTRYCVLPEEQKYPIENADFHHHVPSGRLTAQVQYTSSFPNRVTIVFYLTSYNITAHAYEINTTSGFLNTCLSAFAAISVFVRAICLYFLVNNIIGTYLLRELNIYVSNFQYIFSIFDIIIEQLIFILMNIKR